MCIKNEIANLYGNKDIPLAEAVFLYEQIYKPLMLDEIQEAFGELKHWEPTHEADENWLATAKNNLFFKQSVTDLLGSACLWVAYECISQILEKAEEGITDYMQVFTYKRKKFWVILENDYVLFLLPEDY